MRKKISEKKTVNNYFLILFLIFIAFTAWNTFSVKAQEPTAEPSGENPLSFNIETKGHIISEVPFEMTIKAQDDKGKVIETFNSPVKITMKEGQLLKELEGGKQEPITELSGFKEGVLTVDKAIIPKGGSNAITVEAAGVTNTKAVRVIPGILTILPPLLAIGLALTLRQVVISLFCGIWLGAIFVYDYNIFIAFLRSLDTFLVQSLASSSHVSIIIFSLFLGGMVAVISRSGGAQGMVDIIAKKAKTSQSGQIATWLMGLVIFFDDYANTLIVGNSMRPLTDKLKISREKLSFIVDATAAPVTNIAVISTWIGFEIGVIGDKLQEIGADKLSAIGVSPDAYIVFLQTIPYRFYPVLTIIFVFLVGWLMRDFGPMLAAERRAAETGEVLSPTAKPLSTLDTSSIEIHESVPKRWYNAIVPIASVIIFTIWGLWYSGSLAIEASKGAEYLATAKVYEVLGQADSLQVLIWASVGGSLVAIIMVLIQKIMDLEEAISCWIEGIKSIVPAAIILVLAWGIGIICKDLNTAGYLALVSRGNIAPQLLPFLIFILAAVISFATGTSWGTMSIVMPIAIHIGFNLPPAEMDPLMKGSILLGSVAGVLAGATFGDHCSPISDTTIMSSMASGADHIDHVRTQAPYALTVAAVGALLGSIPSGYGMNPLISMVLCTGVLFLILKFLGKNPLENAGKKNDVELVKTE